ncbi:MAG TPA: hypothetical protein PLR91_12795 [Kiritimatiellia bacterium]|nr:hypothetical protein [Kiritimatiellia bacterium]
MLYGLQASKDVKLSCIGRGLDEGILLKKTKERLSRNLLREGLDEGIFRAVAREGAKRVGMDTLVVVDPTASHGSSTDAENGATNGMCPEPPTCSRNCPCSPQAEN